MIAAARVVVVVVASLLLPLLAGSTCQRGPVRNPRPEPVPTLFIMPGRPVCDGTAAAAVDVAVVTEPGLHEVSGAASSLLSPGVLWMLADAGNDPAVYAVSSTTGVVLLTVMLPIDNVDFEDAGVGPCPDLSGPCVYVADTGDNDGVRERVVVYVFPEPVLLDDTPVGVVTLEALWRLPLRFPDGESVDVEALAVFPDASALVLFEKTSDRSARVFAARAPWQPESADDATPQLLEETGRVEVPVDAGAPDDDRRITGAAMHWSGTRLLLRFDGGFVEYAGDAVQVLDPRLMTQRQAWPEPDNEPRGEAVTWANDGVTVLSIGEAVAVDEVPVLHRSDCQP